MTFPMPRLAVAAPPTWAVLARDENLATPDVPYSVFMKAEVNLLYNDVGTFAITLPSVSHVAQQLRNAGSGILFMRGGEVILSGSIRNSSLEPKNQEQPEQWKFTGVDDNHVLRAALCYPNPDLAVGSQTSTHYVDSNVNAETALRNLVFNQIGAGAHVDKQIPNVVLEPTNNNQGNVITVKNRFGNLLDVMKRVADRGGVGFRIVQVGTQLEFRVFTPQDRSDVVQFSAGKKNLRKEPGYAIRAPKYRSVVVGAGGQGTNRLFDRYVRSDAAQWPWVYDELFADRRDLDPAAADTPEEMQKEADERLAENGPSTSLTIDPVDAPGTAYGVDYEIGDIVGAQIAPGEQVTDIVRGVNLVLAEGDGRKVTPTIGNLNASDTELTPITDLYKRILSLAREQQDQGARQ